MAKDQQVFNVNNTRPAEFLPPKCAEMVGAKVRWGGAGAPPHGDDCACFLTLIDEEKPKRHAEFDVHVLNDRGIEVVGSIRDMFDSLVEALGCSGASTYYYLKAKEHLEIACFYAKKGVAVNPKMQLPATTSDEADHGAP